MNGKRSFGNVMIGILKCLAYLAVWFIIQLAVTFFAEIAIILANRGASLDKITELVNAKGVEITLLSNLVMILAFSIFYRIRKSNLTNAIRLNRMPSYFTFSAVLLGISLQIIVVLIVNIVATAFPDLLKQFEDVNSSLSNHEMSFVMVLSVGIIAPIAEEMLFRGLILNKLNQNMNKWIAIVISALIFGIAHGSVIGFIYTFPIGFIMGWLYIKFDSVLPSILFHMSFNITSLVLDEISYVAIVFSVIIAVTEIVSIAKYRMK